MSKWISVKLEDCCDINKKTISSKELQILNKIKYLDTGAVSDGKFSELKDFDFQNAPSRARRIVSEQDIVYSLVRPNQKHYGFLANPPKNLIVSTGFVTISSKKDENNKSICDTKFIYYYITQDSIVNNLHAIAEESTSTYPSLKPEDIQKLNIKLPSLVEQKSIAEILTSLDDKIENLTKQNLILESLIQTLFKSINPNPLMKKESEKS